MWEIDRLWNEPYSDEWPDRAKELDMASREVAKILEKYNATLHEKQWIMSRLPYIARLTFAQEDYNTGGNHERLG